MITLTVMTSNEYNHYINIAIPDYAQDKIKAGTWKKEEALILSKQTFLSSLPKQQETMYEYLYCIQLNAVTIGYVWFHFQPEKSTAAFIYDFLILEAYQNQGYGTKAMTLIENKARAVGASSLSLHVFAHNERAVHVYKSKGFHFTDYSMTKKL